MIPVVLALASTLAVWLVIRRLSRDGQRAGLATSLLVGLFFAFNRCTLALNAVLDELSRYWVGRDHNVHPLVMLALLTAIAVPVLRALFVRLKNPASWTSSLNRFALILVALPTINVVLARINEPSKPILRHGSGGVATAATLAERPDIYFIILDAYARSDVMRDLFGFDNEPFLGRLEQKGFFVARQSTANYCQTSLSLSSTLNGDYLDRLVHPKVKDRDPLAELICDNLVIRSLRPHGYKFVTFTTGYDQTECPEADVYLYPRHPANNFHTMLIRMTPLRFLPLKSEFWDFYTSIRERTLFVLDELPKIALREEPTFTFAHIISPHHPFVFGENGEDISPRQRWASVTGGSRHSYFGGPKEYRENYPKQARFLTKRIEQTIDRILANSPRPPIIILQSDHGSGLRHHLNDLEKTDLRERMSILNCYYFPGRKYHQLNDRITPVNSFRAVLTTFFGAHLPPLENRNYFSTYEDAFRFTDVTERLRTNADQDRSYTPPTFYPGLVH